MSKELLNLIHYYSSMFKTVDEEYIRKLVKIVISSKLLEDYVKEVEIVKGDHLNKKFSQGREVANYSFASKKISVFYENLMLYKFQYIYHQEFLNHFEFVIVKNLIMSQKILHELEHANQHKMMIQNDGSLEAEVLRLSIDPTLGDEFKSLLSITNFLSVIKSLGDFNDKRGENYTQNYFLAPEERLANIKSHQEILDTFSVMGGFATNILNYEKICILENMLQGYINKKGDLISPTVTYLKNNNVTPFLKATDWFDEDPRVCLRKSQERYSLEERLKCGLMIDREEYEKVNQTLKLLKK